MANIPLPEDFSAFLKLLNAHEVKYLLVGGYAVGYHGYVGATADMDIWILSEPQNAYRLVTVLRTFGFDAPDFTPNLFLENDQVIRMGVPPLRIEVLTSVSGVTFQECYRDREVHQWQDVAVNIISLKHLILNKKASGRHKDLADLEYLE